MTAGLFIPAKIQSKSPCFHWSEKFLPGLMRQEGDEPTAGRLMSRVQAECGEKKKKTNMAQRVGSGPCPEAMGLFEVVCSSITLLNLIILESELWKEWSRECVLEENQVSVVGSSRKQAQ